MTIGDLGTFEGRDYDQPGKGGDGVGPVRAFDSYTRTRTHGTWTFGNSARASSHLSTPRNTCLAVDLHRLHETLPPTSTHGRRPT